MKKYAFIIDIARCENCNNCFLSCKDEHCGNDWPGYTRPQPLHGHRWINILQKERGAFPLMDVAYLPKPCMHCDDAPCVTAGKGAIRKRDDGIVLIVPEKGRDRQELTHACPYGAIWWNEEEKTVQKCTFCAHLLDDGWQVPRCVQSCPTGALTIFHDNDEELAEKVGAEGLETLPSATTVQTRPRCYYKNLYRYTRSFLTGSIARMENGVEECVVGANVVLKQGGEVVATQESDDFGDFKFDGLHENSGEYQLEISAGEDLVHRDVTLSAASVSVGLIMLDSR